MKNINEGQEGQQNDLETLELKANLNPEQREYLEVLKDKMKKVLGNKTKQELAKAGDLESLKKYKAILIQILEFLRTKEMTFENEAEKQIMLVKKAMQNAMKDGDMDEEERGRLLAELAVQINDIITENDLKFHTTTEEDILVKPEKDFSVQEIFDQIVGKEKELKDKLYVISGSATEDGIITELEIGVAGKPFNIYKFNNSGSEAKIENFKYIDFVWDGGHFEESVAEYDSISNVWKEPDQFEDEEDDPDWDGKTDIHDEI